MIYSDLTAFEASQLQYLRSQVDRAQDEIYRSDVEPNAKNKFFYATEDLRTFTSKLRASGRNI